VVFLTLSLPYRMDDAISEMNATSESSIGIELHQKVPDILYERIALPLVSRTKRFPRLECNCPRRTLGSCSVPDTEPR
jgi:hypothetical protein